MFKFVLKILTLFIGIYSMIFGVIIYKRTIILSKDIEEKVNIAGNSNYEILIEGDSRGESGLNPDLFLKKKVFNLSVP